ncbi:uncharacterized protein HMPREF1541_08337 [Cyphellophora europaea CBS 101466]|uniref:SPT2 chromatin protein n=1 Tax=Cyphellophora europaea (strain CBS 101466) TaxID=1220924 RepID=W2RLH9_CYPE1|nr:uncharacterized protein HMPREF1541_08337 [Cyphellophora europaea CBS 101466]ETN37346.1 hypothetical protein HMPREF1541_08337 [Cyphellophora europaea CBS 101466]
MSFLGGIVSSIGGDKAPPPPQLPKKSATTNSARTVTAPPKPTSRPSTPSQMSGVKRKAEEPASAVSYKSTKPASGAEGGTVPHKPAAPPLNAPRPQADKAPVPHIQTDKMAKAAPAKPSPTAAVSSPKPPPSKGSYAELMARAKAQNSVQKIGVITHNKAAPKEKLSKRAEQRRSEEEKARREKSGNGGPRKADGRRSASPMKNGVQEGRISKASTKPGYKGTLGMSAGRERPRQPKASRYDSYLGTDEEDNSDVEDEDDYGDGYESSDMEGGFDDLESEEQAALRLAKADDARELALENQLKREKEERRRRLMNLAAKRK